MQNKNLNPIDGAICTHGKSYYAADKVDALLESKEKELDRITEEAVNYLDRIEKLDKELENARAKN